MRAAITTTAMILLLAAAPPRYVRSVANYSPPAVTLVDAQGNRVPLANVLDTREPVILQFIFTTCPSVCPVLLATLASARKELGAGVRMVSISIDPDYDTPARLRDYSKQFGAAPQWWFLTGSSDDVAAVQKAFGAWRGNKMRHESLVFVRLEPGRRWIRLAGPLAASELVAELRRTQ